MKSFDSGWQRRRFLALATVVALSACSGPNKSVSHLQDNSVPNPRPADPATIDSQLQRYSGQTEFMNVRESYMRWGDGPVYAGARSAKSAEGQRAIQESDIFKVGKEGSKLLYLLNDYRGLQVVSFANGADAPALVGRVEATGNYPENMFYDEANDRLIVLERNWFDADSGQYRSSESRLLVYDVKDATNPKIASTLRIEGEIADSRLVGDILYVATSVWPDWRMNRGEINGTGHLYAYKLSADSQVPIIEVAQHSLSLPVSRRENMNIVEVESEGSFQYYLVAILSKSGWGWWDRQSAVEVIDISSAAGSIKPVMIASARGFIEERSATHIKNNTLIVASNYTTEGVQGTPALMRVAVETFKFPAEGTANISENEATYRRLHIDREMARIPAGTDREEYLKRLVNDPELGIAGVFVKDEGGSLRKLMPDATVTVGDSTGLHADLQDVRFAGNLLYVFWVPANMRDPLDIIDIAAPETGIRHLKRELFEGWIERAFPIDYKGKTFILGLGWVVPGVNNEDPRRVPQAVLFEVEKRDNGVRVDTVSQLSLLGRNVWADFNDSDKFVEIRHNEDGTGAILFKISSWNDRYISGGKLLGFDLNQAISGNDEKVFAEGGLLSGSSEWLRRVFTNPEIDRINTLTNKSLGVFNINWKRLGTADEIHEAVGTLELARDIQAYTTINTATGLAGIQFVNEGNYWNWDEPAQTLLRLVSPEKADQERNAIDAELRLNGQYLAHLTTDSSLLIVTSYNRRAPSDDDDDTMSGYQTVYEVAQVMVDGTAGAKLKLAGSTSFTETARTNFGHRIWWPVYSREAKLTKLASGRIVLTTFASIKDVVVDATSVNVSEIALGDSCSRTEGTNWSIESFNGDLYMTYAINVVHPDTRKADLGLSKNYIAKINELPGGLACAQGINIPGKVLAINAAQQAVTEDQRLIDLREHKSEYKDSNGNDVVSYYFEPVTAKVLVSTVIKPNSAGVGAADQAELRDIYDLQNSTSGIFTLPGNKFVMAEKSGEYSYAQLSTIGLEQDAHFNKRSYTLTMEQDYGAARILTVVANPETAGGFQAIVAQGRRAQVVSWDNTDARPAPRLVRVVGANLEQQAPVSTFLVQGWWGWGTTSTVNFSPAQNSFEIPEGLSGLKQIFVIKQ